MQKHLIVAAIDFGTTYSGWAYSFRNEFERDPVHVSSKNWTGGPVVTPKAPTCVLIKSDGKTLDSFGYQAEKHYAELAADDSRKHVYFFRHFKMMLYGRIGIERRIKLEDISGKKLPAKTVFGLAIKYLKDDLIKTAASRIGEENLSTEDVLWVLTVPAIWNDAARHFMREAAEEAGIDGNHLLICLEPEAASLFCRCLPMEKSYSKGQVSLAEFQPGTKYLVLDAGGGTIDITVHEVLPDNNLRELYKASGGDWGGTQVDRAFEEFLGEVLGKNVIQKFKKRHMEDYTELFWDFEIKKKEVTFDENNKTAIRFSVFLSDLALEINGHTVKECVMRSRFKESIIVTGDKLRINADVMRSFFQATTEKNLVHLADLLTKPAASGCSAIVMAGGFSEAHILQKNIRERFGQMKVIIPEEAGLAVLKGAVIYGHNPDVIAERVCRFTYGKSLTHKSNSSKCNHPPGRQEVDSNGDLRCYDLFKILVKAGQTVRIGEEGEVASSRPVTDDQTKICVQIYSSSNLDPVFVTDDGCTEIGRFRIDISDTSVGRERVFKTKLLFWGTEIKVQIEDTESGEITIKYVDFLG